MTKRIFYKWMCKGHPGPAATATRDVPIGRDPRRSTRMPDPRGLILLSVVSTVAALLLVAAPASAETFTNPTEIKIPASGTEGAASPYPSSVAVSGMSGPITDVNVTLHRVGHTSPHYIQILLVSPLGDTVNLMSGNCGGEDIEDFLWTFDQQASTPMPRSGDGTCPEFVYRPNANNFTGITWPTPAHPGPHGTSLNDFNNENPNGTWSLYVFDGFDGDVGDIEVGWSLTVTTGPVDVAIPSSGTSGAASPYPATRTISGATGIISDVNVSIDGIWHQHPDDLDLLLVGPEGQKVILMSDACGSFEVAAYGWAWDDEAAAPMPDGTSDDLCNARFHRPTDYGSGDGADIWPAPAPAGPYSTSLSAFDGTDPNGEWRLFVNDDAAGDTGFFTNRFQLQITTSERPNSQPVASNDSYRGKEDKILRVPARGVLRNDIDADGDALTASVVSRPNKGKLSLKPNGAFTYKPKKNSNGIVRFVYRASDGRGGTDNATVTLRIKARPR